MGSFKLVTGLFSFTFKFQLTPKVCEASTSPKSFGEVPPQNDVDLQDSKGGKVRI